MPTKKPVPKKAAKPAPKAVAKKTAPKNAVKPAAKKAAVKQVAAKATAVEVKKTAAKAVPVAPQPKKAEKGKAVTKAKVLKADTVATRVKPAPITEPVATKAAGLPDKETKELKNSTKTSITIMPENKSIDPKQTAPKGTGDALVRYNDTDLTEFRDLINRKMDAAKKELNYLQGLITRKDDMGGDESESRYMTMEDGSMSMEREQLSQMASRQITYIDHLEKALIRIENKTYGICRVTGKLIDKARLRAVPHATLSLEAKLGLVKPSGE